MKMNKKMTKMKPQVGKRREEGERQREKQITLVNGGSKRFVVVVFFLFGSLLLCLKIMLVGNLVVFSIYSSLPTLLLFCLWLKYTT